MDDEILDWPDVEQIESDEYIPDEYTEAELEEMAYELVVNNPDMTAQDLQYQMYLKTGYKFGDEITVWGNKALIRLNS